MLLTGQFRRFAVCSLVSISSSPAPLRAQPASESSTIAWHVPAECSSLSEFRAALAGLIGDPSSLPEERGGIEVSMTPTAPDRWHLEVTVRRDGHAVRRTLEASECRELSTAAALWVATHLEALGNASADPELGPTDSNSATQTDASEPASSRSQLEITRDDAARLGRDLPPSRALPRGELTDPSMPSAELERRVDADRRPRLGLSLGFSVDLGAGALVGLRTGGGVRLALSRRWFRFDFGFDYGTRVWAPPGTLDVATIHDLRGRALVCVEPRVGRLRIPSCVGAQVHGFVARARAPARDLPGSPPAIAAPGLAADIGLQLALTSRISLTAGAFAGLNLVRPQFTLVGQADPIESVRWFEVGGYAGFALHFGRCFGGGDQSCRDRGL